jgi:hypothetical protein
MSAAEETARNLYAMANYLALAMLTNGGNRLDRALEAVESVMFACCYKFETLVIFVAAYFAGGHRTLLS